MKDMIITIGRQYGSGGREIGEKLANRLGISYYDTMILEKAASNGSLSNEIIQKYDEQITDKWLHPTFSMGGVQIMYCVNKKMCCVHSFVRIWTTGRNLLGCKKYISKLRDMEMPQIMEYLYGIRVCVCKACGGHLGKPQIRMPLRC